MARDRVRIIKRDNMWQVRYRGETAQQFDTYEQAAKYVAQQLKMRAAIKSIGTRLLTNYMKGRADG